MTLSDGVELKEWKMPIIIYSNDGIMIQELNGFVPKNTLPHLRYPTEEELNKIITNAKNTLKELKEKKLDKITADCGCYIVDGSPNPTIELVCEEHVGSSVYGDYDKKETAICNELYNKLWRMKNDRPA